jgi:hypothetical protein
MGQKGRGMYIGGAVAVLLLIFAVLLMLGVVPMTPVVVGAMFIGVCIGFAGPFVVRSA